MLRAMLLEIAIAVIAVAALAKLVRDRQPAPPAMSTYSESDTEPGWDGPELPYFDPPLARVSYGTKPGARVFGWPAKGGVYILGASAVEVEFLGYGRFEHVPRPDPTDPDTAADEEAHCNKMRQLGAVWWESEHAWAADLRAVRQIPQKKTFIATGWPAGGGVWVLSEDRGVASRKQAGMLFNAFTMEERCKMIEQLGGTFYANPKDCPHLDLA